MKRKKRKKRTDKIILSLVFLFMLSIGAVTLLKSDFFNLSKVDIIGNNSLKKSEIVDLEKLITNKNIFSYNLKEIKNNIISNPYIEDVEVKRKLPNKIIISIKEKEVIALLSNGQEFCYVDNNGNLIKKIDKLDENNDKIIVNADYDVNNNKINFKNEESKNSVLSLLSLLKKEHLEHEILEIEYIKDSKIDVSAKNGAKFLIINDDNLDYNIARLSKILVDLQSKNIKSGVVDLTYTNYAVYKPS